MNLQNRKTLVQSMPRGICAEIGVKEGVFAKVIYATQPIHLHLIDCWEEQEGDYALDKANFEQEESYAKVVKRFGGLDDVTIWKEYSVPASTRFPDEYLHWLFLDANHFYDSVTQDMEAWWPKICKGGWMTGHDYIERPHPFIQVQQAVDEFVRDNNLSLVLTDERWKSWAIQKPGG